MYIYTYFFNAKGITGIFFNMGMHVYLFKIDPDGGKYIQKFKNKTKQNKQHTYP